MSPPTKTSAMLVSGEYFDYLAPDPAVITLDVFEHGLDIPRFNNQTVRPITVLEHSLHVRRIVRELGGDDHAQLWALLHDAHEALVPWGDCLRPGKTEAMKAVEAEVDEAIITALGIDEAVLLGGDDDAWITITDIVHTADMIALYFEAMLWMPGAIDWAPFVMPFEYIEARSSAEAIQRLLPLIAPRPGECWRTEVEALLGAGQ